MGASSLPNRCTQIGEEPLFQTLHPPYLTNTNGNARSDALRVAHAVSVYAPDAMVAPTGDRGRQVFKLDRLAHANGYNRDNAHEAMADVETTIFMVRLIRDRAPDVWKAMDRATTNPGFPIWLWYFRPFDQSSSLDFRGFLERNQATEGDTQWVNYKRSPFSSRSTDF